MTDQGIIFARTLSVGRTQQMNNETIKSNSLVNEPRNSWTNAQLALAMIEWNSTKTQMTKLITCNAYRSF